MKDSPPYWLQLIVEIKTQLPVILDTEYWYLCNAWKNKDTNATEKKKYIGNDTFNKGKYDNDLELIGICDNSDKLRILNNIIDQGD